MTLGESINLLANPLSRVILSPAKLGVRISAIGQQSIFNKDFSSWEDASRSLRSK